MTFDVVDADFEQRIRRASRNLLKSASDPARELLSWMRRYSCREIGRGRDR
jgi:hypothetical protein